MALKRSSPVQKISRRRRERAKYFNQQELKDAGWTGGLIKKFLGEPDKYASNPHNRSGPPIKLFLKTRVAAAQAQLEFESALAKARIHSGEAKLRCSQQAAALCEEIEAEVIDIPIMDYQELIRRACDHYNARRDIDRPALNPQSDTETLERIAVNYLRHELSPYEKRLQEIAGRAGANEARYLMRMKILDAIEDQYSELMEECAHQSKRYLEEWMAT